MSGVEIKLADLCEVITKGTTPSNIGAEFTDDGIKYIRSEMLTSSKYITEDGFLYISEDTHNKLKRSQLKAGDILFSMAGVYLGKTAILRECDVPSNTNQAVALIRVIPEKCNREFVYYYLNLPEVVKSVNSITGQAAQPNINLKQIGNIPILLPSREIQDQIVFLVSAYDDLIEKNQKQIKLLEEAAQRLYKEWFVDLRFPGHETTPITDGIPEGWIASTVGSICDLKKDTVLASKIAADTPYIGLEHMPRADFCLSNWGTAEDATSNKFRYAENDIIFGKIRPYFHKVGFTLNNGVVSTDSFVMVAKQGLWGLLLMTVFDKAFVDYTYQTCKEGAKMPRADWNQMEKYPVLVPSDDVRKKFEDYIWTVTRRIKALALQNHALAEARDRLLPKLMNGEIEV